MVMPFSYLNKAATIVRNHECFVNSCWYWAFITRLMTAKSVRGSQYQEQIWQGN